MKIIYIDFIEQGLGRIIKVKSSFCENELTKKIDPFFLNYAKFFDYKDLNEYFNGLNYDFKNVEDIEYFYNFLNRNLPAHYHFIKDNIQVEFEYEIKIIS